MVGSKALSSPIPIASITPGPNSILTLGGPYKPTPGGRVQISGSAGMKGVDGTYSSLQAGTSPDGDSGWVLSNGPTSGAYSGGGSLTDIGAQPPSPTNPTTAPIVDATSGPSSELTTLGDHGFASGDKVNITGVTGIEGVNSPVSGGWQSAVIASISPGPNSVVTLASPKTIPPGTSITVQDGAQPPGDPSAMPPVPPGVSIVDVTVGPNSIIETSAPHGFVSGDALLVFGVTGIDGVNSASGPSPIPWTANVVDATHVKIDNGSTPGVYVSGGTVVASMGGVGGLYTRDEYLQTSPTTIQLSNGVTIGASHAGAEATWSEPLVTSKWTIEVTGEDTFTIPNAATSGVYTPPAPIVVPGAGTFPGSNGTATDVGP
jgi:hypothetical protein